jgi:hypothetical protein
MLPSGKDFFQTSPPVARSTSRRARDLFLARLGDEQPAADEAARAVVQSREVLHLHVLPVAQPERGRRVRLASVAAADDVDVGVVLEQ